MWRIACSSVTSLLIPLLRQQTQVNWRRRNVLQFGLRFYDAMIWMQDAML